MVCNWYTQISSLIDLLKHSIKARGIQRLVVPPHSNPLTKEIEIAFKMIEKWKKKMDHILMHQNFLKKWESWLYFIFILLIYNHLTKLTMQISDHMLQIFIFLEVYSVINYTRLVQRISQNAYYVIVYTLLCISKHSWILYDRSNTLQHLPFDGLYKICEILRVHHLVLSLLICVCIC